MVDKRVVITGLGIISPGGIGKDAFNASVFGGASGIKPISLFDTSGFKVKTAGEVEKFNPEEILGPKGLRTLDRSTRLVIAAAKLALDDASLEISQANTDDIGVAVGSTLGSLHSISEFDKEAIKEGPRFVNPALFPNTVINSPASQVSIRFGIRGFNTTVSTGFSAALDAVNYAADFLRLGRARAVLAGGVEELCVQTFLGFYKTGFLAGLESSKPEISCPFDKRRNGIILGEGSAIMVLEDLGSALARQAKIYAEVRGFGMGFDAYKINSYNPGSDGLKKAMRLAIKESDAKDTDIDYICAGANSTPQGDLLESRAIKEVFGPGAKKIPVSSIKSTLGESFSASGAFGIAAAVGAIDKQMAPPTINYQQKDEGCDLNYVANKACGFKIENVLVNAFGPSGGNSSLVISRFKN